MNSRPRPRKVTLHIDTLVIDGVPTGPGFPGALESELTQALSQLVAGGATPSEAHLGAAVQQCVGRALLTTTPGKESR